MLSAVTPVGPSAFQVFVRCWWECTQHSTHTLCFSTVYKKNAFTDVYQRHTVCTAAYYTTECWWRHAPCTPAAASPPLPRPPRLQCESSAIHLVTSRHLLLMWSAWMFVCTPELKSMNNCLVLHCTTIKHGYRWKLTLSVGSVTFWFIFFVWSLRLDRSLSDHFLKEKNEN